MTNDDQVTLDPADWDKFRTLAHRMVDDMLDHLQTAREQPAWQPVPQTIQRALRESLPREPQGEEQVYAEFRERVMPYTNGNRHPRFFGWVQGNGTALGMMADMLASGLNPHMAGFAQAPALVEEQVIRWFVELMGFPISASGVLTLGATTANMLGLAVARHVQAGFDVGEHGLSGSPQRLLVYASDETHSWLVKAAQLMGFGRASLRFAPTDAEGRVVVAELQRMITADRRAGHRPLCVIGTAGTVNTGAIDDLAALADLSRAEGMWFHVDGAFGALVTLSDELRGRVRGIERADSLAFDLHKWMYLPFDVACVLVRDAAAHHATFTHKASYLAQLERGVAAGGLTFGNRGIDLTRSFRALKVWMSMKAHGVSTFARLIEQNVAQATHLAHLVKEQPELELLASVPLNIVCFRYRTSEFDASALDRLNEELLLRIQESGLAVPSSTVLRGRFALRCAIANHRTRIEDLDLLVEAVIRTGRDIAQEMRT